MTEASSFELPPFCNYQPRVAGHLTIRHVPGCATLLRTRIKITDPVRRKSAAILNAIYDPAAVSDERGLARSPRPVVPPRTFLQEALTDSAVCCDGCGRRFCSRVRRRCLCRPALLRRGDQIGETGCTTMRLRLRWAEEFGGQLPRRVGSEFANVHARACRRILFECLLLVERHGTDPLS